MGKPRAASLPHRCSQLRPHAFVQKTGAPELREIPLRFDTLWLIPNAELGVAVYRGLFEVEEDDAADVEHPLLGCEGHAQEKKPLAHCADVLFGRTDGKQRGLEVMRDQDLLPPLPP
ncbi:MAG: hypothetical protein AAGA56_23015, partial [Myxococcota bacterium]